jgi:hypothetical protein
MGSARPPKTVFTHTDLDQLEWVFEAVTTALEAQRGRIEDSTKGYIRRRLFVLACNGMTDPDKLREHLLMSFGHPKAAAIPPKTKPEERRPG